MGALWSREGKNGPYMTGVITIGDTAHQVVLFKNKKEKPNQPDWRVFKSRPKPELNDNGTEKVDDGIPF